MNLRLSILLVLMLVIFGGTFLAIRFTGSVENPDTRPWLYSIDSEDIAHISVNMQGDTVSYERKAGSNDWSILGEPDIPVFPPKWAGITLLLSGPKVTRVLPDTIENPEDFGLAPPVSRITIIDRGGNSLEFHLGDTTPDPEQQYARLLGDPTLFTVPVSMADVINGLVGNPPFLQLYQVDDRALQLIQVISGDQGVIYVKEQNTGQWYIQGETPVPVFTEAWGETLKFIGGPKVDRVVVESFDDPSLYGMDHPQASVRFALQSGHVTEFQLGNLTNDGRHRYAQVFGNPTLYAMPEEWAKRVSDLAIKLP